MIVKEHIEKPTVAIVHFINNEIWAKEHGQRIVYYQVTIDPNSTSKGGFIRFGNIEGDEIHGWIPEEDLVIDEVLDELETAPYINNLKQQAA